MTTSGFGRMVIGMLDAEILIEPYVPIISPLCLKMPKLTLVKCPIKYRYVFSMY